MESRLEWSGTEVAANGARRCYDADLYTNDCSVRRVLQRRLGSRAPLDDIGGVTHDRKWSCRRRVCRVRSRVPGGARVLLHRTALVAPRRRTLRLACACLCWARTAAWTVASDRRRVLEVLGGAAAYGSVGAVRSLRGSLAAAPVALADRVECGRPLLLALLLGPDVHVVAALECDASSLGGLPRAVCREHRVEPPRALRRRAEQMRPTATSAHRTSAST